MMKRRQIQAFAATEIKPEVKLWVLRLLVVLDGHREFIKIDGLQNFSLARLLGMEHWSEPIDGQFDWMTARKELRQLYKVTERCGRRSDSPSALRTNLARLSSVIGLSDIDCRILEFVVHLKAEQALDDASNFLGALSSVKVFKSLAIILGLEEGDIRTSLHSRSILAKSGLLKLESHGGTLGMRLELLSDDFAENISSCEADPIEFIRGSVARSSPCQLNLTDYAHVKDALAILRPYLRQSLADGRKGVNVFLYGKPGTGKTQLAKVLALDLDCQLYEVACEDSEGDSIDGERRLRAFCVAQSFFAHRRTLLLFDEVEDVFADGDGLLGRRSTAQQRKAWMNRTLEENSVPTIWISNSRSLDPAFVRRFDMIFELPVPPRSQRERITRKVCLDLLTEGAVERISDSEALAPALITRACSVVGSIRKELDQPEVAPAIEFLISSTLQAQGHSPICKQTSANRTAYYDPEFIHADTDLIELTHGLTQTKAGRLCFYGPPGTGKTAFAHWLVDQVKVPLIVKRGSDLISPFVGETERNIAAAFREAEQTQSALLIDEVDSFLQDRRTAQQTWEISLVNEMLVQIEAFAGIFIASTNIMQGLDPAVLRRFDLKVRFGFLKPDQAWRLFGRYCSLRNIPPPSLYLREKLRCLSTLTLGDFAVIDRQRLFNQIDTADAVLTELIKECSFKDDKRIRIGFL